VEGKSCFCVVCVLKEQVSKTLKNISFYGGKEINYIICVELQLIFAQVIPCKQRFFSTTFF